MKRTLLLALLLATMPTLWAQTLTLTTQGQCKQIGLRNSVLGYTQCYGLDSASVYLRYATGTAMNVGKVCFGRFNHDLQLQNQLQFPSSKATPMAIFVNSRDVAMILRHQNNRLLDVTCQHYDKNTLQPIGDPLTLKHVDMKTGHMAHTEASTSANNQHLATLCLEQMPDSTVSAQVSLFNRALDQQWQMEANFVGCDNASWDLMSGLLHGAYSSFFVSDQGQVLVASNFIGENNNTNLYLIYMDGTQKSTHLIKTNTLGIRSAKVVKYDNDRAYITGNIESVYAKNVFHPTLYTRELYLMVYNLKQKAIESLETYTLTPDDCRVLRNQPASAKITEAYSTVFTGAVCNSEGITVTFASKGALVMHADNQGHILWTRALRNGHDVSWDLISLVQVETLPLGNKVLLAMNRNQSNIDRKPTKAAAEYDPGKSNAVLSLFLIDSQGNVEESNLTLPKKSGMLGHPLPLAQGGFLLLGAADNRGYWGRLQ